jgi:hypothetical protein
LALSGRLDIIMIIHMAVVNMNSHKIIKVGIWLKNHRGAGSAQGRADRPARMARL